MPSNIPIDLAAAAITQIATNVVNQALTPSVVTPQGQQSDLTSPLPGSAVGGNAPAFLCSGTGIGGGPDTAVFSNVVGGFNPAQLNSVSATPSSTGTPTAPRYGSASASFITGIIGDSMSVVVKWTPPLVDTNGRWLIGTAAGATGALNTADSLQSYLITREDASGAVTTVGAVSHNDQAVSLSKVWLEANNYATTNPVTQVADFLPGILVGGVVTLPTLE